jgi:hypothetical protein
VPWEPRKGIEDRGPGLGSEIREPDLVLQGLGYWYLIQRLYGVIYGNRS